MAATEVGLDAALQLSPLDPMLYGMHGVRSQMFIQSGDYAAAARWGDRAAATPGAHYLIAMIAMVANGLAGRHDTAARWRQTVRQRKLQMRVLRITLPPFRPAISHPDR